MAIVELWTWGIRDLTANAGETFRAFTGIATVFCVSTSCIVTTWIIRTGHRCSNILTVQAVIAERNTFSFITNSS